MQALNSLYKLNSKLSVHQERLSTGKRVNSAQDDTAAFSVAKNVETTKQGHERALQNIKNAQSILSIAEAAQQKQLELMQNIREKLYRGKDTTLNTSQKEAIFNSIKEIHQEIIDIGENTSFNGKKLNDDQNSYATFRDGTQWTFTVGSGTSTDSTFDAFISLYNAFPSVLDSDLSEFNDNNYTNLISFGTLDNAHGIDYKLNKITTFIQ